MALVEDLDVDMDWAALMPTWKTKGLSRGLLAWGETRGSRKKGLASKKIMQKSNCIPELCRAPAQRAMDKYFYHIGAPPVVAGKLIL